MDNGAIQAKYHQVALLKLVHSLLEHQCTGPVAQWITRLPTEQKIVGSSPAWIENLFFCSSIQFQSLTIQKLV